MSDLKVCRICLRAQCKVYKHERFQLQAYYEEVMAQKMNESDGLPLYFCYECATLLHQYHKFKEKCWLGQRVLKQIQLSWNGNITYEAIHHVDRAAFHLKSPLEVLSLTKKVKTYVVYDETETHSESEYKETDNEKDISIKDIEDEQIVLEQATDNCYDSDTPLEDMKNNIDKLIVTMETSNEASNSEDETVMLTEDDEKIFTETDCKIDVQENAMANPKTKLNITMETKKEKEEAFNPNDDPVMLTKDNDKFDETDCKIEVEENTLGSPKTVFVDVKKDVIVLKNEPIKQRKRNNSGLRFSKVSPRFAKRKRNYPDKESWKIYSLTEEEAVKEFQLRADREQYKNAPFQCLDCLKGFSKENMLKRHKQLRHSERGKMECRFCHKRYKWDCKLRRHMVEHFTRYKCLKCDIIVCLETTALLHEEWHKGIIKRCEHCGEEFRHRSTYYTHLRTHRSGHVCTLCGMSFVSPSGLNMHMKIKHIDNSVSDEDDDDAPVNTFCERCDIRFETRKAYEEHLFHSALHTDTIEDKKEKNSTKKILGKRTQEIMLGKRSPKRLQSRSGDGKADVIRGSVDDIVSSGPKYGRKARRRRSHKKPTTCHQCGKHFATQAECMKHHYAEHPRTSFYTERHICEICGASLAPGSVKMHENMHSRQKEYPCDTCGRKFHTQASLKRHTVTHTGEKPFACTLCDKKFTQSNSCKLHYNTFHLRKPYPKRNRRKRKNSPPDVPLEDKSTSEESLGTPENTPGIEPATSQQLQESDSLHYLTLS